MCKLLFTLDCLFPTRITTQTEAKDVKKNLFFIAHHEVYIHSPIYVAIKFGAI